MSDAHVIATIGARLFDVDVDTFRDWRWQMSQQVRDGDHAARLLGLDTSERARWAALWRDTATPWPAGLTPYVIALARATDLDEAITRQYFPDPRELAPTIGDLDPLDEEANSPVPEVIHLYPDRVAFCVAELCPAYCRFCFRKRRGQRPGAHFNETIIERGLRYIAATPAIRDVLITGGDPFLGSDHAIERLLDRLRAISHVDIIRLGTRVPATLPYRVTDTLTRVIAARHPVFVNTHFNNAIEVTADARESIERLVNAGIPVGNQAVLLRGVNDSADAQIALGRALLRCRARPYYLFHPHRVAGTDHLRPSIASGVRVTRAMRGNITGLGIPAFIVDTPSGKIPVAHPHLLGIEGPDTLLEDPRGAIWRERSSNET